MQTPGSDLSLPNRAQQVCFSCRTRKRKCDKLLPRCSQCVKRDSTCQYLRPAESRTPESTSDHLWYHSPTGDDLPRTQCIDFPTVLFLDPSILKHGQTDTIGASIPVPQHVFRLLGDIEDIRDSASKFFGQIHSWMRFISKKRFYDLYLRPAYQSRADIVLFFLALKLITTPPPTNPRNPRTQLYHATKHFYLEVESSSIFSICVLQAGVLIAFYELGHGIYPAAYMSIGACARYAHALGVNVGGASRPRKILTLVEVEERRRVWWAIVILDRYGVRINDYRFVSIGCPGRPFATAEPPIDSLFPADDAAWDEGIVSRNSCWTLSLPSSTHMSRFSLLCQAARILGQVLETVSNETRIQGDAWVQLDRTLNSMLSAALEVVSPGFCQISFIYSALIALYTPFLAQDAPNTPRAERGRVVLQEITERIKANLIERQCAADRDPDEMSPWGLFFAYQICAFHMRAGQETEVVKKLRDAFPRIDVRWNVAGTYIQLLEAQEVMNHCDRRAQ